MVKMNDLQWNTAQHLLALGFAFLDAAPLFDDFLGSSKALISIFTRI